jgi:hypothetical protein
MKKPGRSSSTMGFRALISMMLFTLGTGTIVTLKFPSAGLWSGKDIANKGWFKRV